MNADVDCVTPHGHQPQPVVLHKGARQSGGRLVAVSLLGAHSDQPPERSSYQNRPTLAVVAEFGRAELRGCQMAHRFRSQPTIIRSKPACISPGHPGRFDHKPGAGGRDPITTAGLCQLTAAPDSMGPNGTWRSPLKRLGRVLEGSVADDPLRIFEARPASGLLRPRKRCHSGCAVVSSRFQPPS
jgi:hypothetical protein